MASLSPAEWSTHSVLRKYVFYYDPGLDRPTQVNVIPTSVITSFLKNTLCATSNKKGINFRDRETYCQVQSVCVCGGMGWARRRERPSEYILQKSQLFKMLQME